MKILSNKAIKQKLNRLAIQILEVHFDSEKIILLGINNKGYRFASLLAEKLQQLTNTTIQLEKLKVNPAEPTKEPVRLSVDVASLEGKNLIIVDDVANTGRTLYYALKPLMDIIPASVECAVLVDRMHKSFPIRVDFVGLSLATTLKEHIEVDLDNNDWSVVLE